MKIKKFFATVSIATLTTFTLAACGGDGDGDRDAYTDGVKKILVDAAGGVDDKMMDEIAECVTDATFDEISDEGKKSIMDGKDVTSGEDGQLLYSATSTCAAEAID